jgi:hypothetical protein
MKHSKKRYSKKRNIKNMRKTRKYLQRSGMLRSSSINRLTQTSKNLYSKSKDLANKSKDLANKSKDLTKKAKDVGEDIVTEVGKEQIKTGMKMVMNKKPPIPSVSFTPMKKSVNFTEKKYTNKLSNINKNNSLLSEDYDYKTPKIVKTNVDIGETSPEKNYNENNQEMMSHYQKIKELNTIKRNLDFENED